MLLSNEAHPREPSAPNAILERMRRRIAHVGLLVAVVSTLLATLVIFAICACSHMRL